MVNILKGLTKLRVKAYQAPLTGNKILGTGIDVMKMPDGHISCPACQSPWFEVWVVFDKHRIEIGCIKCGWSERLLLPWDLDLSNFVKSGRFSCFKHKNAGMAIIKNKETLCIGCQNCRSEIRLKLEKKSNLVLLN